MSSTIESVLRENRVFQTPQGLVKQANISGMAAYEAMCKEAEKDFEGFWAKHARNEILWTKPGGCCARSPRARTSRRTSPRSRTPRSSSS